MNKLFITMATIGALAMAAPAFAQRTSPGPTAETGTGPGVIPPGGYGPSSPLFKAYPGSPNLFGALPWGVVQESAAPAPQQQATPSAATTESR
jgi:hypothetical protein